MPGAEKVPAKDVKKGFVVTAYGRNGKVFDVTPNQVTKGNLAIWVEFKGGGMQSLNVAPNDKVAVVKRPGERKAVPLTKVEAREKKEKAQAKRDEKKPPQGLVGKIERWLDRAYEPLTAVGGASLARFAEVRRMLAKARAPTNQAARLWLDVGGTPEEHAELDTTLKAANRKLKAGESVADELAALQRLLKTYARTTVKQLASAKPKAERRYFEFREGSSSKFWEIEIYGKQLGIRFGRIDTIGQRQSKHFPDSAAAVTAAGKLVAEKLKKGYRETPRP